MYNMSLIENWIWL